MVSRFRGFCTCYFIHNKSARSSPVWRKWCSYGRGWSILTYHTCWVYSYLSLQLQLTVVAKGPRSNGLYRLENRGFEVNFSDRQVVASEAVWHYRLGHSNPKILQQFSSSKEIMMNKSRTTPLCGPCQMWKSSILQFFLQFQMYLSL